MTLYIVVTVTKVGGEGGRPDSVMSSSPAPLPVCWWLSGPSYLVMSQRVWADFSRDCSQTVGPDGA